jgi:arsenite transporter
MNRITKHLIVTFPAMMVNLNQQKVFEDGNLKARALTLIINFGIIPFAAYAAGYVKFTDRIWSS